MVIFHSYVSLPEGSYWQIPLFDPADPRNQNFLRVAQEEEEVQIMFSDDKCFKISKSPVVDNCWWFDDWGCWICVWICEKTTINECIMIIMALIQKWCLFDGLYGYTPVQWEFLFAILSTDIQQRCVFHQKSWILPTSMWILKSEMWIQATNMWIETTTMWNDVDLSQFWEKDWRNAGAFTFPKWDFVSNKVYEKPDQMRFCPMSTLDFHKPYIGCLIGGIA